MSHSLVNNIARVEERAIGAENEKSEPDRRSGMREQKIRKRRASGRVDYDYEASPLSSSALFFIFGAPALPLAIWRYAPSR